MAEMILVRHGQAAFGSDDYDRLSPLGVRQSIRLGEYFATQSLTFDKVVTGSLLRQRQTADGILSGMRADIAREEDPDFDEYDFYALYHAAIAQYPPLEAEMNGGLRAFYRGLKRVLQLWSEDAIVGPTPERWDQFHARVARARRRIQASGWQRVLAVSSGGVIATMIQQVLAAPPRSAIDLNLQIYNTSLTPMSLP
ncbi:MAG: histidine phosphatase family protein [Azonexus sp.]|jgi:broad specificity phosphatase PhoE|nr:histidine phosphatase family protein [Azonexus sp.]